jgi:hypothetical protein
VLGQGAYGKVFAGTYHGTAVAIKEISNKLLDIEKLKADGNLTEADTAETLRNELVFAQLIR